MTVIDQGHSSDPACHEIGRQGIQIIGNEKCRFFPEQKAQKEPQVKAGIEQGAPGKDHSVTPVFEWPVFKFRTASQAPAHTKYLKALFREQFGHTPDPLIRCQIIYDRYVYPLQD
jgi:hypothetical protein